MKMTSLTIGALAYRRQMRDLKAKGYEQISCAHGIGQLWELDRGYRRGWRITDVVLGVDGKTIYAKAVPTSHGQHQTGS